MNEVLNPIIEPDPRAQIEELQRELWNYGAVIDGGKLKVIKNGIVAIIKLNLELKKLAFQFDGPEENIDIKTIEALEKTRSRLYLAFKNEKPSFVVYKSTEPISDDTVKEAYNKIKPEDRFLEFNKEIEKILKQRDNQEKKAS